MRVYIVFAVFLSILLIPSFCIAAEGPTDQGVYSLAGSASYSHYSTDASDQTADTFSFNPTFTYFVIPNVAVGLEALYSYSDFDSGTGYDYGGGPIIRLYAPVKWEVKPFFAASYIYSKGKSETTDNTFKSERTDELINLSVGLDYFLSRNVALETTVGYSFRSRDWKNTGSASGIQPSNRDDEAFDLRLGINVFIY